jgi:hypothetical protein
MKTKTMQKVGQHNVEIVEINGRAAKPQRQ